MTEGAGTLFMDRGEGNFERWLLWGGIAIGSVFVLLKDFALPTVGHFVVDRNVKDTLSQFEQAFSQTASPVSTSSSPVYTIVVDDRIVGQLPSPENQKNVLTANQPQADFGRLRSDISASIWNSRYIVPEVRMKCEGGGCLIKEQDLVRSEFLKGGLFTSFEKGLSRIWDVLQKRGFPHFEEYVPMAQTPAPAAPTSPQPGREMASLAQSIQPL